MAGHTEHPSVVQAIAAVMAELPGIGKTDKAPQGYAYRGIEAVTSALQPLCARHGVVIVPQAHVLGIEPAAAIRDGWQDLHLQVTWRIYGPAGDHIEATTIGIGRDNSDKGANKAHTQALKYLLLTLFMVADRADDGDGHQPPSADQQPPRARPARPRAAEPAAAPPLSDDVRAIGHLLDELRVPKRAKLGTVQRMAGREVTGASDLTPAEAHQVRLALEAELLTREDARADEIEQQLAAEVEA